MRRFYTFLLLVTVCILSLVAAAPIAPPDNSVGGDRVKATADSVTVADSLLSDSTLAGLPSAAGDDETLFDEAAADDSFHQQLKTKFIDGNVGFMSLVALTLVLGLAFCIERLIYLSLSEINYRKLLEDIEKHVKDDDIEGAKTLCRNTRGPVASICYQGLLHAKQPIETIERSIANYGGLQTASLEKGNSWIKLFIAMAPSLGFLGTVIGMVMAFDQIQSAGDISPTIVAQGMKVALITTIFGIVVALILQLFYSYILSKIEKLTGDMEEAAIELLDIIETYKNHK